MNTTIDLLNPARVFRSTEPVAARKAAEWVKGATNDAEDKILRVLRAGTVVATVSELSAVTGLSNAATEKWLKNLMYNRKLVRLGNDPVFGTPRYEPCGTY